MTWLLVLRHESSRLGLIDLGRHRVFSITALLVALRCSLCHDLIFGVTTKVAVWCHDLGLWVVTGLGCCYDRAHAQRV